MNKKRWIGLSVVILLSAGCIAGVHAASRWYEADWKAVRDCRATYFACTSTVTGEPRLESLRSEAPTFEGHAKGCQQYPAWERAIFRAKFECNVSTRVENGTCREVKTDCELTGS